MIDTVTRAHGARGEPTTPADLWFAIESDRFFRVPSSARRMRRWRTNRARSSTCSAGRRRCSTAGSAACHVLEIPFVFGLHDAPHLAPFTGAGANADALDAQMMQAWVAFARTDDPSTPEVEWPRHDPRTRPTMFFAEESRVEHAPRDEERAAVDTHARPF